MRVLVLPWALPLAPQRVHNKASPSLLLVPEAGPLVGARPANSSAVPPFKPQKVSSLLVSISFLSWGGRTGFGWLERSSSPISPSSTTYRNQYIVLRRRSLAFPSLCVHRRYSFRCHPSHDELWVMRINSIFL